MERLINFSKLLRIINDKNDKTIIINYKEVKIMSKISSNSHDKGQLDHHSNQNNPNNSAYQDNLDNRANQLNPNNKEYKGK